MKFIYQELIEKEILKHKGIEISKHATFTIHNMTSGFLEPKSGAIEVVSLYICSGKVYGVFDKSSNYCETEFTLCDIDYQSKHYFACDIKLKAHRDID